LTQVNGDAPYLLEDGLTMHATRRFLHFLAGAAITLAALSPAVSQEAPGFASEDTELGPVFLLSLGGKLYDDAWPILDQSRPEGRNPALEDAVSIPARDTWRCVTCHGWDYSGGEIGGKRFPGLAALMNAEPDDVKERMLDPAHPFPAKELPELAMDLLALFVSDGQYKRGDFLDAEGNALGNPEFGRDIFEGACMNCHQLDGRRFLRGESGDRSSLGWVARNRPEQALHKIVNGVPAAEMLSLRFLSEAQIADVLAYLQTLDPAEQ
jgi:thiosulfate dehydrogenase